MAAPKIVTELVERFDRNKKVYCGSGYNETRLRREFLRPFFEALGWDVDNKRGVSPLYEEVVQEYGTDVEGSLKTADYAFRVGEKVKFFVEAKKPGTKLKDDPSPARQLRRYAFSKTLPLSILTDFEEFAAYDGRVPPKKAEAASRARVMYFTYDQYEEAWDEIAAVFSRDAVWSGAFDKYADENRGGKAEPVDKLFLKLLEGWRDELARNVANRNREKDLDKYELSGAVQAILDRIIFLRVAEDRGIEDRGRLEALQKGEGVYGRLMVLCLEADDVYNSGLFHFRDEKGRATSRDELTPNLHVDDSTLRKIIRELSESPYEFGVVPVEILGQVYEQFLGKTIWLDGQGVHIDYKPEVRKAKGVYYTPQYIVEYIVKNTLGELLKECKNPKDAAKLKILDPACGSGSFLLGAYQHLINWHLEWCVADNPAKHEGKVVATPGPGPVSWRLTAAAKKDILLNNIFGVDIDRQAVEVTKLSLLLKALEGESRESVGAQTKFLRERMLPDLGANIKCGNSLIGSDYWDFMREKQAELFERTEKEERRVNPFDWEVGFKEIMNAGGFDAVIGNPPYVNIENIEITARSYLVSRYGENNKLGKRYDIYQVFVLRGCMLLRNAGLLGFILPNTFLMGYSYAVLRKKMTENVSIRKLVDLPQGVFKNVVVDNVLMVVQREAEEKKRLANKMEIFRLSPRSDKSRVATADWDEAFEVAQRLITEKDKYKININANPEQRKLFAKLESLSSKLGEITESSQGIILYKTAEDAKEAAYTGLKKKKGWKKLLRGKNIGRYSIRWDGEYVDYGPGLWCARDDRYFNSPKILLQAIRNKSLIRRLIGTYDGERYYNAHNLANIIALPGAKYNLKYVLGLFNSRLLNYWYKAHFPNVNINPNDFRQLPLKRVDFNDPSDVARHDKMVALVDEMLELHKRLAAARSDADKKMYEKAVAATDRKIDALVYVLYGLTDDEIKTLESA